MTENNFTARNPDFKEYIIDKLKGQYFMKHIGFELTKIEAGRIEGEMKIEQKHLQQHGFVHGGVSSTLMDIVMGFAAYSLVDKGQGVVTANLSIDYHHPGVGHTIKAIGTVDKMGAKMAFCSAELFVESEKGSTRICKGKSLMAIIEGG